MQVHSEEWMVRVSSEADENLEAMIAKSDRNAAIAQRMRNLFIGVSCAVPCTVGSLIPNTCWDFGSKWGIPTSW